MEESRRPRHEISIIRPIGYRLTKQSKLLYKEPAYLICTSVKLPVEKLLQAYYGDGELRYFRDQKTLLGCGQAQVRKNPCSKVPQFVTAVYSMLLLASSQAKIIDLPKWYTKFQRTTTQDL